MPEKVASSEVQRLVRVVAVKAFSLFSRNYTCGRCGYLLDRIGRNIYVCYACRVEYCLTIERRFAPISDPVPPEVCFVRALSIPDPMIPRLIEYCGLCDHKLDGFTCPVCSRIYNHESEEHFSCMLYSDEWKGDKIPAGEYKLCDHCGRLYKSYRVIDDNAPVLS